MGLLYDLKELFRLSYDPFKDKDELPVRGHVKAANLRVATNKASGEAIHEGPDGKLYARKIEQSDAGQVSFVFDSSDIRTDTNVSPNVTKYDQYVFDHMKGQDEYKHFDAKLYEKVKRYAFSKSLDGKPISRRKALNVPELKGVGGLSDKYMANYFKAMKIALNLECQNTPLPSGEGVAV